MVSTIRRIFQDFQWYSEQSHFIVMMTTSLHNLVQPWLNISHLTPCTNTQLLLTWKGKSTVFAELNSIIFLLKLIFSYQLFQKQYLLYEVVNNKTTYNCYTWKSHIHQKLVFYQIVNNKATYNCYTWKFHIHERGSNGTIFAAYAKAIRCLRI